MNSYPTKYTDIHGSEDTIITNDGSTLRMTIRGLDFVGIDFDSFELSGDATPEQLKTFVLNHDSLCSCRIECRIPIPVYENGKQVDGNLAIDLLLGAPRLNGSIDREELSIVLTYNEQMFEGLGKSGWFEDELIDIQKQLPDGTHMQACINCLFSDYSPYGHGLFGNMMCFRNLKKEYLKVEGKDDFWSIHDHYDQLVQETFLCSEFQLRTSSVGYRG